MFCYTRGLRLPAPNAITMPHPTPRPPLFPLRVGKSATGFGIFADEDIPADRFIIEYWGEVVPNEVADKVAGRYLFELENGKTILGGTRKNVARYINHACRPNAESRTVGNRVTIHSIKAIKAGEEVTYNYGTEYFNVIIGGTKKCRCARCVQRRARRNG